MEQKLLELTPKRYLCPFCGEWHDWELSYELGYYDSELYKAELGCERQISNCKHREMHIYFSDGYCYYRTVPTCTRGDLDIKSKIPIEDIVESSEKPRVTFDVPFTARRDVGRIECRDCDSKDRCLMRKLGDENNSHLMHITFGFEFEQSDYEKFSRAASLARREKELQELQQPQVKENKEDTTMANSIFNMNMEFGPNKDENIASTLMGVAVKNGDSWRIYDKNKKEITDVGDMQLGNLPIFILPTTNLSEGDLIKDAGEYYFVIKVKSGSTKTMCAKTGEIKEVIPIKNVLGFSCYSKVIAISDSLNMGDDFDVEKLAITSAMCGQPGEDSQMNQLLPLMLCKDKFGGDEDIEDIMKMVLMSSMMTSGENGDQMNQFLPLMLFKDKFGGDEDIEDIMKMVLMSSMMSSNMSGSNNNPLMGYLMLKTFMKKKEDETPQQNFPYPLPPQ